MAFQGIVEFRDGSMFALGARMRRKASGLSVSIE
jgi:hypothetical protein